MSGKILFIHPIRGLVIGTPSKEFLKTMAGVPPEKVSDAEYNKIADAYNSVANSNPGMFSEQRFKKR